MQKLRRKFSILTFALICASGIAQPAHAWNDVGHMAIAGVAYKKLNPAVKERANALIRLNPYYRNWQNLLPAKASASDKDMMTFMLAATWPDAIKGDHSYSKDGGNNGHKPEEPIASRNIGYSDHYLHKYWHFIDYPISVDDTPLPAVPAPNAETEILDFRKTIHSADASDDVKSYDLTWLLHIVGDIHQPLHCVTRAARDHRDGDAGGNMVMVKTKSTDTNLHAYWDNILGMDNHPDKVMRLVKKLPKLDSSASTSTEPHDWTQESFELAKTKVYADPVGSTNGPFVLDKRYEKNAEKLAQKQVVVAGNRLANLLNDSLL